MCWSPPKRVPRAPCWWDRTWPLGQPQKQTAHFLTLFCECVTLTGQNKVGDSTVANFISAAPALSWAEEDPSDLWFLPHSCWRALLMLITLHQTSDKFLVMFAISIKCLNAAFVTDYMRKHHIQLKRENSSSVPSELLMRSGWNFWWFYCIDAIERT